MPRRRPNAIRLSIPRARKLGSKRFEDLSRRATLTPLSVHPNKRRRVR